MERITADTFKNTTRCLQMDDTVFLPQDRMAFEEQRRVGKWLGEQKWFKSLLPRDLADAIASPDAAHTMWSFLVQVLADRYEDYLYLHRAEPPWVQHLNAGTLRRIRREATIRGPCSEPHTIVPEAPLIGFGYVVEEGGLAEATIAAFGIYRLQGIRQLGFLHDPVVRQALSGIKGSGTLFAHTRYLHTHDVHALAFLLARNNGLSQDDENHLRVAALTHDALTPAGGDSIKLVAPELLDEETNYPKLFERPEWKRLKRDFRLSEERLHAIVLNQGTLGVLLDFADKIAYVARDASMFFMRLQLLGLTVRHGVFTKIREFVDAHPRACTVWDSITVLDDGRVVAEDGKRLADFLELRALLFRNVYYAPEARFLEHLLAKVVVQYLVDEGMISIPDLLAKDDHWLELRIDEVMGDYFCSRTIGYDLQSYAETFLEEPEARVRQRELVSQGALTLLDWFDGSASAGGTMLVRKNGIVLPFKDAYPSRAQAILRTLRDAKPYRLYYLWPETIECGGSHGIELIRSHHQKRVLET